MTVSENTIPTIDIGPWLNPNGSERARDGVVQAVSQACSTYGFFNLIGHGVPVEAQQKIFECTKKFFDLPLEEKLEVSVDKSLGKSFRGYEPSKIQTHQDGLLPDTKEVKEFIIYLGFWNNKLKDSIVFHYRCGSPSKPPRRRHFFHGTKPLADGSPQGRISNTRDGVSPQNA